MLITVSNRSGSYALPFQPGQTLLDALRQAGLPVSAPCGGRGTCGKCTVYLSTPDGERAVLACQTAAEDGMALRLLEEGPWPWSWKGSSILCPALRTRKRLAGASPATSAPPPWCAIWWSCPPAAPPPPWGRATPSGPSAAM